MSSKKAAPATKPAAAPAKEAPKKTEAPKKAEAPKEAPKKVETPKEQPKPAAPAPAAAPAAAPAKKDEKKAAPAAAPAKKDEKKAAPAPAAAPAKAKKAAAPVAVNNSFLKPGKVVILLHGRQAGHKAVIVRALRADKARPFPTLLVAGIERYPLKVTRAMGPRKIARRSQVKSFLKIVNVAHVMPTRYSMDVDLKTVAEVAKTYGDATKRRKAKNTIRRAFEARYESGKNRWFFQKLRF